MDAVATPSGAVAGTAASGVILGMVEGMDWSDYGHEYIQSQQHFAEWEQR